MTEQCPQLESNDIGIARYGIMAAARQYGVRLTAEDLDDLAQDVIVLFLERVDPARLRHRAAYLSRIGRNAFLDLVRRRRAAKRDSRLTVALEGFDAPSAISPERQYAEREDLTARLRACRKVLHPRHFKILVLSYAHGLTGTEVAKACDISPTHVHSVLSRVRRRLSTVGITLGARSPC